MKYITTILLFLLMFGFYSCEKEHHQRKIEHVGTYYGGANNYTEKEIENISNYQASKKRDTTLYYFKNDTLVIFVELSYLCCTPFDALYEISNDTIRMNIYDACTPFNSPCYCRCTCNYSFEYSFASLAASKYIYEVTLYNAEKDTILTVSSGLIENLAQ